MDDFGGGAFNQPQIGLPGSNNIAKNIKASLHNNFDILAAAGIAAVNTGVNMLFGGGGDDGSDAKNAATIAKYWYDMNAWGMGRVKTEEDDKWLDKSLDIKLYNAYWQKRLKDDKNQDVYDYALQIRNRQQQGLNDQYVKSEQLYADSLSLNSIKAQTAKDGQLTALTEKIQALTFDNADEILNSLVTSSQQAALGMSGRSAGKAAQSQLAELGRNQAALAESMVSSQRATKKAIGDITLQHQMADMQAGARRMLHPGELPAPKTPYDVPLAEFLYPRDLGAFDFGPQPEMGAMHDTGGGGGGFFDQFMGNFANQFGSDLGGELTDSFSKNNSYNVGQSNLGNPNQNIGSYDLSNNYSTEWATW